MRSRVETLGSHASRPCSPIPSPVGKMVRCDGSYRGNAGVGVGIGVGIGLERTMVKTPQRWIYPS